MSQLQKTLKQKVKFAGVGVHSGQATVITLKPAPAQTGIVFCNVSNPAQSIVIGQVVPEAAMHATVIKGNGWFVSTIEHLMAALSMLGVDNVIVEVQGHEIPILDGSALPFVQGLLDAGLIEVPAVREYLTPTQMLTLTDQSGRSICIESIHSGINSLIVDYTADLMHPLAGNTHFTGTITSDFFAQQIAPARTFGFLEQLPFLRQHNLARGSSLSNSIVIGQEVLNDLRFPDECVRHKVLDLIGDLSLLGKQLVGSIKACKTSHNFNRLVVEHYIKHPEAWRVIS